MEKYSYVNKSNENLRNAIHKAYGKRCYYCGEKINMHQLEIDHIYPKKNEKISEKEILEYIEELKNKGFITDCVANYLPCCSHCNKTKNNNPFSLGNLRYFHEQALLHLNEINSFYKEYKYEISNDLKISRSKELENDLSYDCDEEIIDTIDQCLYIYGLGDVRITAYLPTNLKDKIKCRLNFKQLGMSDCMLFLNHEDILNFLFCGYNTGVSKERNYILYIENDEIGIQLPKTFFITKYNVAEQLTKLADKLYQVYHDRIDLFIETLGATYFKQRDQARFAIINLPKHIWYDMVDFANNHDSLYGDTVWDVFIPTNSRIKSHIKLSNNHLSNIESDVLAELYIENNDSELVEILWGQGYCYNHREMEDFDNKIKWKVDFTHDWILNRFIPYIIFLNKYYKKNKLFKKKININFEDFLNDFNYEKYGIVSLQLHN